MAPDRPSYAVSGDGFHRHLTDAIRLNRERMPRYAALTAGASLPISRRLIRAERLALPVAWWIDRRARRWQNRGIPVVAAEFVDMAAAPPFRDRYEARPPPVDAYRPPDPRALARRVRSAMRRGGFPEASRILAEALSATGAQAGLGCMLRHMLESALRISNLAPVHARRAEVLGIEPPTGISLWLLRLHLLALPAAVRLDRLAAPIQANGTPILCQDVPPIPTDPTAIDS